MKWWVVLIIILIVLFAGYAIFFFVGESNAKKNISSTMNIGQACLNARLTIDMGSTCYNQNSKELNIKVNRGSEQSDIIGFNISIDSKSFSFKEGMAYANIGMDNSDYNKPIVIPRIASSEKYAINYIESIGLVKIAPIIKVGTIERVCSVTDSELISSCT